MSKINPGLNKVDKNAPFWQQLNDDDAPIINVNGHDMKQCMYNLLISRRDMNLYCKADMKPHRYWKIGDVKRYFGVKGGKEKLRDSLDHIYQELVERKQKINLEK
jgi:hypothetical protein